MSARTPSLALLSRRLVLELMIAVAVIGVACVAVLPHAETALFKAKFTEVLLVLSAERVASIERFAHVGTWAEADAPPVEDDSGAQRDHERAQTQGRQAKPEAVKPAPLQSGERAVSGLNYGVVDGTVVASGTLRGRRILASMRPAVPDLASNWSVLWLCGARQAPAGWEEAPGGAALQLPPGFAPSVCRPERTS